MRCQRENRWVGDDGGRKRELFGADDAQVRTREGVAVSRRCASCSQNSESPGTSVAMGIVRSRRLALLPIGIGAWSKRSPFKSPVHWSLVAGNPAEAVPP